MSEPVVAVAEDGTGRVWIVDDGTGKSWYRAGADVGWVDLNENFLDLDPRWHPEVAAMLLTVKALSKFL